MNRRAKLFLGFLVVTLVTATSAVAQPLRPTAAVTIRNMPEMGIFELIGQDQRGDGVQSSYFRTTTQNREFRRGIAEFSIPSVTILSATLVLAETRGGVAEPVPSDVHQLISYTPADLVVTTDDYDRAGAAVGTLSTDVNDEKQTFKFDVTALAVSAAGGTLGFRVQLAGDPAYSDFRPLGSEFRVTLGIVTPPPLGIGFVFRPNPLRLASRGRRVTGYLEPPLPFAAGDIDIASIRLNGTVSVDPAAPTVLEDHDGNGVASLIVKFDREAVELALSEGDNVPVTVTGTVDGQAFSGTDHVGVRRGRLSTPVVSVLLAGHAVEQVRWEAPSDIPVGSVALFFSADGGGTWSAITRGQPNTGSCDWTVPNVQTEQAKVAVLSESTDGDGTFVDGMVGVSENFSIGAAAGVDPKGPGQLSLAIRTPSQVPDGRIRVEFTLPDGSPARLELMDVAGRALVSQQVGSLGPGRHALDLSSGRPFAPGIYFLRLTQNEREVRARAAVLRRSVRHRRASRSRGHDPTTAGRSFHTV